LPRELDGILRGPRSQSEPVDADSEQAHRVRERKPEQASRLEHPQALLQESKPLQKRNVFDHVLGQDARRRAAFEFERFANIVLGVEVLPGRGELVWTRAEVEKKAHFSAILGEWWHWTKRSFVAKSSELGAARSRLACSSSAS
jgi:hypothetical protein